MGSSEQRRYPRLSTRQPVTIRAADLALRGEIRDYCGAGLFLDFVSPPPPEAVATLGMSSRVVLDFASEHAGTLRHHRLHARVARSLPSGLGLQVAEMPADVLEALRAAGAPPARSGAASDAASTVTAGARQGMRDQCHALFGAFLERTLKAFFEQSAGDLTNAADQAVGTQQRAQFGDAARDLAGKRSLFLERFGRSIRDALRQPGRALAMTAESPPEALALVDDDQFEDWLNLSTVARRVEADQSSALVVLYRRYGALMDALIDRSNCPFGPEMVCRGFQDALQELDQPTAVRAVVYRTFGISLARHCPPFYTQLNAVLAPMDASTPPPGRAARPDESVAKRLASELPAAAGASNGPTDDGSASIAEILATVRRLQSRHGAESGPASVAASPQRLLRLIDRLLQAPTMASAGQGGGARMGHGGFGPSPEAHHEQADTTGGLLGRALRESANVPEIRALLGRLERPLRDLALRDADFLDSPDHPARRTVDLIDQYAMATDASGRLTDADLRRFLDRLVDRIASQAEPDPALFEVAQRHLAKWLEPVRLARGQRVFELQSACEARDGVGRVARRVDEALARTADGRPLPAPLQRLLQAGLRQQLLILTLRVGEGHPAWQEALSEVERLGEWLHPGFAPGPGFRLEAAEAIARLERQMAAVTMDGEQLVGAIGGLRRALQAVGEPAAIPRLGQLPATDEQVPALPHVQRDVRTIPEAGGDDAARALPVDAGRPPGLLPGGWWLVTRGGDPVPMQLVWVNANADRCALTTRSAAQKLELPVAEFERAKEAGLIAPWSDQDRPLIERSAFSLVDESRQAIRQHAIQDPISGQLSRKGFLQRLQGIARRSGRSRHMVGILEFDQVRMIYGACGADAAQGLVRRLAEAVRDCLGPAAAVAGLRDDTLAVLLPDTGMQAGRQAIEAMMLRLADWRFEHGEQRYSIGLNVGLALYAPELTSPEETVRRSDAACVASRAQGRNRVLAYEPDSLEVKDHESLADWAGRIDGLLEGDGLSLRCQQVVPIGNDAASQPYYEILLAMGPASGETSPAGFVFAVERLKRSHELDLWVLRQVLAWIESHRDAFDAIGGFAINLSPLSLADPAILSFLHERLARPGVPAAKLTFEITETAAIDSYGAAQDFIRQIRPYGCRFSLDDFGSGYTSYAHLKNLHTDSLKIDGSFVRDMATSESDYAMVKSMHEVARSLGMRTVAEYVESPLILARLREIGVDYAQGYALHKPCPIGELAS